MKTKILADERGMAMVMEIVLLAVVLGMLAFAGYQFMQHRKPVAAANNTSPAVNSGGAINVPNEPATTSGVSSGVSSIADQLNSGETNLDSKYSAQDQSSSDNADNAGGAPDASSF